MTIRESRDYSGDQMAAGFALGTVLGLTPLFSLHNLFFLAAPIVFRLSVRAFVFGWLAAIPVGFLLDPVFHAMGAGLLSSATLRGVWVWAVDAPLIPLTSFNNTVTLGSFVFWSVTFVPLFLMGRSWVASPSRDLDRRFPGLARVSSLGRSGVVRRLLGLDSRGRGWVRTGFVFPLALFVAASIGAWWLLADRAARATAERVGTRVVGATVDVGTMDVDLSDGTLAMTGLQVTDPLAPENNIVEIAEIAAAMSTGPLLRAKAAIDSVAVRDVRFNTRRETPGEVDTLRERSTFLRDEMARWRASLRIPTIPTPSFSGPVDFSDLSADSLQTVIRARELGERVGRVRRTLGLSVDALDAAARIDSAAALVVSLEGASIRSLGPAGAAQAVSALRSRAAGITDLGPRLTELQQSLAAEVAGLRRGLAGLDEFRDGDYRRALSVLNLPSFDPDDISAALLQAPLMERVETLLYWARVVDANLPDGTTRSFRFEGPERLRGNGEDVVFSSAGSSLPAFAVNKLEGSVTIGRFTDFVVRVFDLSSDPAVTGRPITLQLTGESGPARAGLDLSLDRTGDVAEDRLVARFVGLPLPALDVAALGARLDLGEGGTRVDLARSGDAIVGEATWSATGATWQRLGPEATGPNAYLWDVVSRLTSVEITLGLDGTLSSPAVSIRSNIGERIASALRDRIGDEVRRAEARARAEVDRLIEQSLSEVRSQVADFEEGVGATLSNYQSELDRVRASLETRLRELTPSLPTLPNLPG